MLRHTAKAASRHSSSQAGSFFWAEMKRTVSSGQALGGEIRFDLRFEPPFIAALGVAADGV